MSSITTPAAAVADDILIVLASGPSGAPLRLRWLPSSSITIADLLSKLPATVTHVRYADPEGDVCTVGSDAELAAAIECAAVPNGRGVGGRPRRVLRVSYDVAADASSVKALVAVSPKVATVEAPASTSPKGRPARPAAAGPKGLGKGHAVVKDGAHLAEKLARLHERSDVLKSKLASSKDAATSARLAERLAAVTAKISTLSNNAAPSTAATASNPTSETLFCTATPGAPVLVSTAIAPELPVCTPEIPACSAAVPKRRPAAGHFKVENFEALLNRNAARAAAVEQKTVELQSAADAARQAGNLKRAANLDAAAARCRQQSAKIAERRETLLNQSVNESAGLAKEPAAAVAAAPTEQVATTSPIVALPVAPLCGLGPISLEQRQAWLSAQHTALLTEISMLSNTIATVRANGHPHRADALGKRMANLQERAARLEQRRAFLATKHAKRAETKPVTTEVAPALKPASAPLTVALTAARPVGRGRGKPQFVAQHQLAKLKERRALIDARIAQLEAEVAADH